MQYDGGGSLAEARLDGVVDGHALWVDVHTDDDLAALALFKVCFGIDQRSGNVVLGHFMACNGLWCRDLGFQLPS